MSILDSLLHKVFGTPHERKVKSLRPVIAQIHEARKKLEVLDDKDLAAKSAEFREALNNGKTLEDIKVEAFAVCQEACDRRLGIFNIFKPKFEFDFATLGNDPEILSTVEAAKADLAAGKPEWEIFMPAKFYAKVRELYPESVKPFRMLPFDVQLIGGLVLHEGAIAEMATGEGKTLVATLPVFLNALAGKGVHVVTVNDYLSKRDSEWMGPLYMFHGLSVDCIDKHEPHSQARRRAYNCDITFGTNNEFGFDYLRDNMSFSTEDLVQRKHHYAIVDEVDSVLIDDARTPLIIAGPVQRDSEFDDDKLYGEFNPYVEELYKAQRLLVNQTLNEAKKLIAAGDENEGGKLLLRAHKGLPKYQPLIKFLSEPGMKVLLQKVENYYMQDNEREMPVVTDELYFVINEQLHSVVKTDKGDAVLAKAVGAEDFFVLPDVGARTAEIMHDDSLSAAEKQQKKDELLEDYSIKSERVHVVEQLLKAYSMFEKDVDYIISPDGKVKIVDESTGRIMEGRRWSDGLHQAVEAKEHVKVEATTQTFATITLQNYFRMYHKLAGMTGTAETEAGEFWSIYKLDVMVIPTNRPVIRDDQDDLIYKTKRAKFNAVIERAIALSKEGRPVLIGTTDVDTSELLERMFKLRGIKPNVLNAKEHAREAEIVAHAGESSTITIATNMAGRGTDIKLSPEVKAKGGLAILGTERHDSRRVDRQLRGRAGRQGDPGSSTFYISLEDKLMRLFGSERIAGVVDKLGMQDDEVLEAPMLSNAIEKAQKKVEENNFGVRKRLLEYDDVMNYQREAIYSRRRNAISGEKVEIDLRNMMLDTADLFVKKYKDLPFEEFQDLLMASYSIDCGFDAQFYDKSRTDAIAERIVEQMQSVYDRRMQAIVEKVAPVIKHVYETQGTIYQNIAIPVSDGRKVLRMGVNLEKAYNSDSREVVKTLTKTLILKEIDDHWKEHLRQMDDLKQSVQNASYEQKDPIVVYKLESYNLFAEMLESLNKDVLSFLFRSFLYLSEGENQQPQRAVQHKQDFSNMQTRHQDLSTNGEAKSRAPIKVEKTVGRNDPCPCGSGKKYKACHGKGKI